MKILGISGSLRSARYNNSTGLCDEIRSIGSEEELRAFIRSQSKIHLKSFMESGREEGLSFDAIYKNLRKRAKDQGLCNSECALVAALWGAHENKCEIDYLCLATHMTPECQIKDEEVLRQKLISADAIILSGPVYFGDRGSLSQSLFEFIRSDAMLRQHVKDKIFAGLAVGAKRNGGQETTLIYQMVDATNLGMLVVGNGAETTAQYGGTSHAGDVGSYDKDEYGTRTSLGTGRRVAEVLRLQASAKEVSEIDSAQIGVWLLQDDLGGRGRKYAEQFCREAEAQIPGVKFVIREITSEFVYRCIACDLCPVAVGPIDEYRCIVTTKDDFFVQNHADLIKDDAVLLMAYSPEDMDRVVSKYQQFIERTRYLRRDNYVFSNRLATAFVITELDANKNLHIRMLTSVIRHNTILHKAVIGYEQNGSLLNSEAIQETLNNFTERARDFTRARLNQFSYETYNPVGYVIGSEFLEENRKSGRLEEDEEGRRRHHEREKERRTGAA